ncbi:MAG: ACP S-malonyltransferase [Planctomycetota bacterium]
MTRAIVFPGQGAQFPGMARAWIDAFPEAREVFGRADDAVGFALSEVCSNDDDAIQRTDLAQPGILATSAAVIEVLRARGLDTARAPLVAGLSLGEYTALWCAGALEFEDAVRLVRLRGEAMQAAAEAIPSSMTSLMGATPEVAAALAAVGARHGICSVANLNAPGQVVVSGELAALDALEAAAPEHGIARTVRLSVAGGFHSECMRPAAERLRAALAETPVSMPRVPVVTNVTARPVTSPDDIRTRLAEQVSAPVLWADSMLFAFEQGATTFLEPAPGRVLAGLLKRIGREAGVQPDVHSVDTPAAVEA